MRQADDGDADGGFFILGADGYGGEDEKGAKSQQGFFHGLRVGEDFLVRRRDSSTRAA